MSFASVASLDHFVLTCASVASTAQWYCRYLGMQSEVFTSATDPSTQRTALKFGTQKINLHQRGKEFEPKAATALPGTADVCFLVEGSTDLEELVKQFQKEGITVLENGKVVQRTGARGPMRSLYIRDPDGNLVELSKYT